MRELYMKRLSTIIIFLLAIIPMMAQIRVSAPQQVAVGEQFRLQYTISTTDVKGFRAGSIPDAFEVLMGPSTSTQQSIQMINGHTTQSSSVTYTYILAAVKKGSFVISGAHATVNGKSMFSNSVKITVSGNAQNQQYGMQGGSQVRPSGSHISGNDLFIKVSANKTRVHEQEPILLTYKVYTQVELTQLEGKMPDLTGFHTQEIPLPQQKSFHIETVNGRPYRCVTWSQYLMYPQMTGKLQIPSITFKGIVVQENRNVDPFEAFFNGGSGYVEKKRNIIAQGMTVQVDPLPQKPSNFSGGVGKFTISASLDHPKVKAGDPVKVRIVVGGNGNLKLIKQPELILPKDFDKYDAKVTDKTKLTASGLTGNMLYDVLIVPRNQGKYQLQPIELTYFDTSANKYKTIRTSPMILEVEKGSGKVGDVADYSQPKDKDIRFIHNGAPEVVKPNDYFFGSTLYIILNALVVLIFFVLLIVFRKQAMEMANIDAMRGKKANKVAGKRLKLAAKLMAAGKSSEFYDEVLRALWGYVADKLSIPVSKLSRENIAEKLSVRNASQSDIDTFLEALDECEFERYAPGDAAGNMQKTYDKAVSAITNIEEGMKKKKHVSGVKCLLIGLGMFGMLSASSSAMAQEAPAKSETIQSLKQKADDAYSKGKYLDAIESYEAALKKGKSANLYYNLGNAYYRTDNVTRAIINYEKARLLAPGDDDIIHNLEVARSKTIDNIQPGEKIFFKVWYENIKTSMGIDTWATLSLVSLVVALLLFLVYLFVKNMMLRKVAFYLSVALVIVFILGNVFASQLKDYTINSKCAVIVSPTATAKKTPTEQGADACILHEGTRGDVIDALKGWYEIRLADGTEGWISEKDVEVIQ
jgi:tetratricopeptide (TPR) repeat protein